MISLADIYHVLVATVPLYVAMALAYICIRWCKFFSPDQCSGINKFVAKISIPLLSFHVISTSNPYQMNLKLIFSDTLQKLMAIVVFSILDRVCFGGNLDWLIMGLSVSTLPNTLIMGIPLLKAMYGDEAAKLLGQIVVLQSLIWYTLLLFLFEFRAAKAITARTIKKTGENIDFAVHVEVEPEALQEIHSIPEGEEAQAPTRKISIQVIMVMVGRKLMENPNTYACIAGLTWGLISFRYGLELPPIVGNSISILSDGGLGMAMFSLGLFTASQSSIIACGTRILVLSMGLRFFIGPILMAIPSYAIGMRGTLLRVAIVQAALPQGIVPFVFAKEYGVHPDILSTGIILGMIVAIPITLAYYSLLYL